jgi:DUF4097 and DUF4098 domain-containing protein YvlB
MKNLLSTLLLAACMLAPGRAAAHDGDDDLVKTKSFTVGKGGTLEVSVGGGDVRVIPWEKGEVAVKVRGADEEDFDDLTMTMSGSTVRIRTGSKWDWSDHMRFEISVPSAFNLDIETSSGNLDIQGALTGTVRASTSAGDVTMGNVTGDVELATSGGDVRAGDVEGDLRMRTSGGDIKAGKVSGEADLSTSGGNIRIANVLKGLHAKTSGGDVTVGDVGGAASVATSGGNIIVGKVTAGADLTTAGGDVDLGGATGTVTVRTAGGNLRLLDIRGNVDGKTAGGDVMVELTPDGKGKSRLASAGGEINLYLADQARATVNARIRVQGSWGRKRDTYRILSDFKGEGGTDSENGRTVTGTYAVNGGGETISLETVNADIQIRKLTGESRKRE